MGCNLKKRQKWKELVENIKMVKFAIEAPIIRKNEIL